MLNEGQKGLICMYACCGGGYGFGHTRRLLNLSYSLRGYRIRFFIKGLIPDFVKEFGVEGGDVGEGMDVEIAGVEGLDEVIEYVNKVRPLVLIHDARDSKTWYIKELIKCTKVITLDDHGEGSVWALVKINALPVVERGNELSRSNFEGFEYIILDERIKREGDDKEVLARVRVNEEGRAGGGGYELLISFGGEDPYGLTRLCYDMLTKGRESGAKPKYKLNIVLGPLYKGENNFVKADKVSKGLSRSEYIEELKKSDVVITSFGMTVYEGLYLRKRVFTLNPTKYHNNLSKELSNELGEVKTLGVLNKATDAFNKAKLLNELISSLNNEVIKGVDFMCYEGLSLMGGERVGAVVEEVIKRSEDKCPICESHGRVYEREGYINSYYCYSCKSFYRSKGYKCGIKYSDSYFTDEYKNQYGKTYLEDKENINRFNRYRIKIIKELLHGMGGGGIFGKTLLSAGNVDVDVGDDKIKLLEVGSGLGFFLELAKEELDAKCYGIELSSYGSRYANEELGLNVLQIDFSKFLCEGDIVRSSKDFVMVEGGYDILCGWYYLEHNADFAEVLGKMKKLLKEGGLLCLSTPNCSGISFKRDKSGYINKIPKDHYIEFSPWSLSKLLEGIGFVIEHIEYRGLYFERIIRSKRYQKLLKVIRRPLLYYYKRYGDTFEIYARKA